MRDSAALSCSEVTSEEIAAYHQDGVVMARGLVHPEWLERIEKAVDRVMAAPSPIASLYSKPQEGFQMEAGLFNSDEDIQAVVRRSPLAQIARAFMGSRNVYFFYDQLFCKQPGNQNATHWHHDITFWPVRGEQILSIWVPLDPVTRESSGLEFVRGSHRWKKEFKAVSPLYNAELLDPAHEVMPDIDADRDAYDLVSWAMVPGDVLIFHPKTVHGSSGNTHLEQQRRAIAFRFLGDDVTYRPTRYTMPFPVAGLQEGDRVGEPSFARIISG